MSYLTRLCCQTRILEFLRESENWVMSYEFWVWVMGFENWVMKTETPLNQTGPNMLGFMLFHARWILGWYDMYARWMLGDAMTDVC